jgi:hypothetical protein
MRRGRATHAAVGIGIAISIRIFFAPLLAYLLLTRQWRAVAVSLVSLLLCAIASLGVFGWAEHSAWIAVMRDVQWPWPSMNGSITGALSRFALDASGYPTAAMPHMVRVGLAISAAFGIFGLTRSVSVGPRSFDQRWLLLLLTCLLAFPVGWIYYWWIFAGPLVASWQVRSVRRAFWCLLPALLVPWFLLKAPASGLTALTSSLYCWGLLALWIGASRNSVATPVPGYDNLRPAGTQRGLLLEESRSA